MPLEAGTTLGHYEIVAPLGAGGMGEVYRARDPRLRRDVAVKVLPPSVSEDAERLRRFEEEACAASRLNDPHVLVVHDVGTDDGVAFIVSELLEGETLRERLRRGALAPGKAADYAAQVARGLAAAHDARLVHRDLKPENIFVTKDERVKILDFGLAKLALPSEVGDADTEAPTRKLDTQPGTILGTVFYMSPEQAEGKHLDHRSDLFSFGAVLYEMLSGRRAFGGETALDTLNSIRKEEPPEISSAGARVPAGLERIARRCLEKKPERRFQSAHDLAFALEALSSETTRAGASGVNPTKPVRRLGREHVAWLLACVFLFVSLVLAALYFRRAPTPASAASFLVYPPEKSVLATGDFPRPAAVSPDGRRLALVVAGGGRTRIWLRPLDSLKAEPLENTDGAQNPFWSPDGRFIAFFAGGKLKKIAASGGVPADLCDASLSSNYGTWGGGDVILFNKGDDSIYRVPAAGGEATQVTKADPARREIYHFWPEFLPDGRHFLFTVGTSPREDSALHVGSLDTGQSEPLLRLNSRAVYAPPGYLLYVREGALLAHPFDAAARRLTGEPVMVVERVGNFGSIGNSYFSVSADGEVLAYQTGASPSRLVWMGRGGDELGPVGQPDKYAWPRLAPDGQRLAVNVVSAKDGTNDVWVYDLARGTSTRFTLNPGQDNVPVWSPDGRRIVYAHDRDGPPHLFWKSLGDVSEAEMLLPATTSAPQIPFDFTPDGRFLLYGERHPKTGNDLLILPLEGERKPQPFLRTPFNETHARLSPDGRWVAYISNESGRAEVYVQPFPAGGERVQVSNASGFAPRWRRDGRELFYLSQRPDQAVMAVPVKTKGDAFVAGTPAALFKTEVSGTDYEVAADGQRFLINTTVGVPPTPLTVTTGWAARLKK